MTPLAFVELHPVWTAILLLVGGAAVGEALAAPVRAWRKWRRPGDCPRCHGTGREP